MTNPNKSKKRNREPIPKDESKVVKFKRVCTPRLRKALKAISLIGNCSTKDYAYNAEQVAVITNSLTDAVTALANQFSGTAAESTAITL